MKNLKEGWKYFRIFKHFFESNGLLQTSMDVYNALDYSDLLIEDVDYILDEMAEDGVLGKCYKNEEFIGYEFYYKL